MLRDSRPTTVAVGDTGRRFSDSEDAKPREAGRTVGVLAGPGSGNGGRLVREWGLGGVGDLTSVPGGSGSDGFWIHALPCSSAHTRLPARARTSGAAATVSQLITPADG